MCKKHIFILTFLLFSPQLLHAEGLSIVTESKYVVDNGDTLYELSKRFSVSIEEIKRSNGLSGSKIEVGATLLIPSPPESSELPPAARAQQTAEPDSVDIDPPGEVLPQPDTYRDIPDQQEFEKHRIKPGDTLSEISKVYGVSVGELRRVNALLDDKIKIGRILLIPPKEIPRQVAPTNTSTAVAAEKTREAPYQPTVTYTVERGDNLTAIAKRHGVSIKSIKSLNGLRSDLIRIGQTIELPGASNRRRVNVSHVVRKGDTLYALALLHGISINELMVHNRLRGSTIRVGQTLSIPSMMGRKEGGADVIVEDETERLRKDIVEYARLHLGSPYRFGGTSFRYGIDCSAFVLKVYEKFDIDLPRTARGIYKVGQPVHKDELEAADLIFFRTYARFPSHVGIYLGDGKFIHASSKAKRIIVSKLDNAYLNKRYIGAKRLALGYKLASLRH